MQMIAQLLFSTLLGLTFANTANPPSTASPSPAKVDSAKVKTDSLESVSDPSRSQDDSSRGKARRSVVIPIHGEVDAGLEFFVKRAIEQATTGDSVPDVILFDVDTWGGRLDAAFEISDAISGIKKCSTAAFVAKKAISAGALIALSTHRVYMAPGATIGDCAPIIQTNEGPQFLGEKVESPLRAKFRALARRSGIPVLLAEKMVTKDMGVVAAKDSANTLNWFTAKNWEDLPDSVKSRYREAQTVIDDGQLLTLDDQEALKWGFSAGTFGDSNELEKAMGWSQSAQLEQTWSEGFVRWISKFVPVLFLLGLACVYIEYKSPGFGFFGIAGILLLGLALGSQFLVGMASYTALFLAAIGLLLIAIEVLLVPGTVVLAAIGLLCLLAALVLSLQGFSVPDPSLPWQALEMKRSLVTVGLAAVGGLVVSLSVVRWIIPYLPMREGPMLKTTLADVPESPSTGDPSGDSSNVGRVVPVVSALRPVGKIELDGEECDAVSNGNMIAVGVRVRLLERRGVEWVVEPVREGEAS